MSKTFIPFYFYYLDVSLNRTRGYIENKNDLKERGTEILALKNSNNYFETLEAVVEFESKLDNILKKSTTYYV